MKSGNVETVTVKNRKKGFTLIEIIAVIIIIAILVAITVPAVREFVSGGRKIAYKSYIKNMEVAAQGYITDCIQDNEKSCGLPDVGESSVISLSDLIEMGFSDRLKDPEEEGYCEESASYVTISNKGASVADIDYEACLYCSNYQTDSPTCIRYTGEGNAPVCGNVKGSSTTWTNVNRTISVGCEKGGDEPGSECAKNEFSKTFIASTDKGSIRISTAGGKTTDCEVDVKVDKDKPSCILRIKEGSVGSNGWYGENAVVEISSQNDTGGSGVLTYGMGTSLNTRDYNKKNEVSVGSGITTVFGYVMDKAGNEGYCSLEVKADTTKPVVSKLLQGYQVYPNKEAFTTTGLTINGNIHTTTNNDPQINITGLTKYKQVSRVVVWFTTPLSAGMSTQVFYRTVGNSYNEENSVTRTVGSGESSITFNVPKDTYEAIRVDLGTASGLTYNISRIEVVTEDTTDLYTNKDIRLYVDGTDTITGISRYSYDDGLTWVTDANKLYGMKQSAMIRIADGAGNISDPAPVLLNNIDKIVPSCTVSLSGSQSNGWYTGNVTVSLINTVDAAETSQYVMSGVDRYGIGSITGGSSLTHTTDTTSSGITYTGYIEDRAGNSNTCTTTFKKDTASPTITFNPNGNSVSEVSQTTAVTHTDGTGSGVNSSQYAWSTSNSVQPTFSSTYTNGQNISITAMNSANYYLWIKVTDSAGNTRITVSNAFNVSAPKYTIAYNANNGSGTMSNTTCKINEACTLSTNTFTRTNYEFLGWSTNSGATSATYTDGASVTNLTTENNTVTLYAVWKSLAYVVTYDVNGGSGIVNSTMCYYGSSCTLTSTVPTRTNYQFLGWSTNSSATNPTYLSGTSVTNLTTPGGVTTLYAVWKSLAYVVTYDVNGGSGIINSTTCYYGSSCTLTSTVPTRTNYEFLGWSANSSATTPTYTSGGSAMDLTTPGGVTTLYAVWKSLAYTVTYNVNGGTGTVNATTCYYGSSCTLTTTVPTRTYYQFLGWATSSSATTPDYASGATVTNLTTAGGTVTLYAVWKSLAYTVTYNVNGGTGTVNATTCYYGSSCTLSSTVPTRTNYQFLGWSTNSSATTPDYASGGSAINLTTAGGTVTLYAVWSSLAYIVTYDVNGGSGIVNSTICYYGSNCTLTTTIPTRTNYEFLGWSTSSSATTPDYAAGATVTNLTTPGGVTALYAVWKIQTYTVVYNVNGGTGTINATTCYYGLSCTLSSTVPTRTNHQFLGWATSSSATTPDYASGSNVTNLTAAGETVTLYAVWKSLAYTVVYNMNSGTGTISNQTCYYGSSCTLSSTVPTRTNYQFLGWSTNSGSTGADYASGATVTNLTTAGGTVTLYAIWSSLAYVVTYDMNGGTGMINSTMCYYGSSCALTSTEPSRTNYEFLGWSTSSSATSATYTSGGTATNLTTPGGVTTLYAVWRSLAYVVTYDTNGGSGVINSTTCYYGSSCTLSSTVPTRTNYQFLGWSTSSSATSADYASGGSATNLTTPGGVTTLYAVWKSLAYTVVYNMNGGTGTISNQTCYYGSSCTLSSTVPTRTNYEFLGWSTSVGATSADYSSSQSVTNLTAAGGTITLYATWKSLAYTVVYNMNGGTGTISNQTCYYGSSCTLSSTVPTRTNYQFLGWSTNSGATSASYTSGQSVTNLTTAGGTVSLYAVWKLQTYTIVYNMNGGSGTISNQTCNYGSSCTLSSTVPTRTNYQFLGWSTTAGATSADYSSGQSVTNLTTAGGTITLYATWKSLAYTVVYSMNGGTGTISNQTCYYGSSCVISSTVPTRTNYDFLGWSTSSGATSASYSSGQSVTNLTSAGGSITLYAVWRIQTYTIVYNMNGGSGTIGNQTCNRGSSCAISSTVPTRTNYDFLGWSTNSGATSASYSSGQSVTDLTSAGGTVTLYAVWRLQTYTIAYNMNGGSGTIGNQTCNRGASCTLSSTMPSRADYQFLGWSTSSGATSASYSSGQSVTNLGSAGTTVTLYAVWVARPPVATIGATPASNSYGWYSSVTRWSGDNAGQYNQRALALTLTAGSGGTGINYWITTSQVANPSESNLGTPTGTLGTSGSVTIKTEGETVYLYYQTVNASGIASNTLEAGPFKVDITPPSRIDYSSTSSCVYTITITDALSGSPTKKGSTYTSARIGYYYAQRSSSGATDCDEYTNTFYGDDATILANGAKMKISANSSTDYPYIFLRGEDQAGNRMGSEDSSLLSDKKDWKYLRKWSSCGSSSAFHTPGSG